MNERKEGGYKEGERKEGKREKEKEGGKIGEKGTENKVEVHREGKRKD